MNVDRLFEDAEKNALIQKHRKHGQVGCGIPGEPATFIEGNTLFLNPETQELLFEKEDYVFLCHDFQKGLMEVVIAYYLKKSEHPNFPFSPVVDDNHRVYAFNYLRNNENGNLLPASDIERLSEKESFYVINVWMNAMAIESQNKHPNNVTP